MKAFLVKYVIFSAIIAAILILLSFLSAFGDAVPFAWICFGLFFIFGLVSYYITARAMQDKFRTFLNVFMGGIIVKLILTAVVVLVYKSKHETSTMNYIVPFAIVYFSFLIFETRELAALSRKTK